MTATFTTDAARDAGGPSWLVARRLAAAEALAGLARPSASDEVWRYSPIGRFELERFARLDNDGGTDPVPVAASAVLSAYPERAGTVVFVNGRAVVAESRAPGLQIVRASELPDASAVLGVAAEAATAAPADYFTALSDAFHHDAVVVTTKPQTHLAGPVVVVHFVSAANRSVLARVVVEAQAQSTISVVEHHISDATEQFTAPVVELISRNDASLSYLSIQELGPRTWQIASQLALVEQNAALSASSAAFGGDYARVRTVSTLSGRGARSTVGAMCFGSGEQTLDFRTFQDHAARDTASDLSFTGVVDGASRSISTGLIRVRDTAAGANAFQTNRSIKLSDAAWAESVPNLEIHNNDVRCSHASAVGPIDEDQRFYLESRGVAPDAAERLIVRGFFADSISRLRLPQAADHVRHGVQAKLDARTDR